MCKESKKYFPIVCGVGVEYTRLEQSGEFVSRFIGCDEDWHPADPTFATNLHAASGFWDTVNELSALMKMPFVKPVEYNTYTIKDGLFRSIPYRVKDGVLEAFVPPGGFTKAVTKMTGTCVPYVLVTAIEEGHFDDAIGLLNLFKNPVKN